MKSNITTVIFSVFQKDKPYHENYRNTLYVSTTLKELTDAVVIPAEGSYKGDKELSFVITNPSRHIMKVIGSIIRHFNQESILVVDKDHKANLLYSKTGKLEEIGSLQFAENVNEGEDYTKLLLDTPMYLKVV